MIRYFKILIMTWQKKAKDWNLKRRALERRGSYRNSLLNIATRHVSLLVAAKIIYTQVRSVSVLLCFSCKIAYWSLSANEMSDLVRLVPAKVAFFASVTVYVNSPIFIKLAQAILNVISTLRSLTERCSSSVIFLRIFFVIR